MNNRYQLLEPVGAGGMGSVFRAFDRLSGQTVALKQVRVDFTPDSDKPHSTGASYDFRKALAQEFRLLASLRHPHIISVLDYGFDDDRQPYFTMELLEGAPNLIDYGRGKTLEEKKRLINQTAQALYYLHRRGIVHRDVKPDNILVKEGQVKVLDFGLAMMQLEDSQKDTVGTLNYMAPDVLRGEPATSSADLYALGVVGFELITGEHPFDYGSVANLLQAVFEQEPRLDLLDVEEHWVDIFRRLLAKYPEDRYPNEYELIQALGIQESATVRESFLQAATFVGRSAEFDQLDQALNRAIGGRGSLWLVGGESGVGKSRLVEELRIHAVVEGVLTLRGQAITEAATPFYMFVDALRRLALHTPLDAFEASILGLLIPDLSDLLGYPVPPAPVIEPAAARNRLFNVIEEVFKRQTKPVLLILEDLQWATDTLNLLTRLATVIHQLPLLIVANYRDDERPQLPKELPTAQVIKLERLTLSAIADLSEAMLGTQGRQEELVSLLNRETEGNVFFIVEVVRALAEETGDLAQIGTRTLPPHVFAGGVQTVVQRRLSHVPPHALPLLKTAAVIGRKLDRRVLEKIAPETTLDHWLLACGSVLDVQDERWQFAHDKLREALLEDLSPNETQTINGQVARAIHEVYGDDPTRAAALSYHYGKAKDFRQEAHFAVMAAEYALKNSSYESTIHYLQRALWLMSDAPASERARLEDMLGRTYFALSRMTESRQALQSALVGYGYPTLQSTPLLILSTVKHILQQALHRVRPPRKTPANVDNLLKAAGIYEQLGEVYFFANDIIPTANAAIKSANLAESAGRDSDELSVAYAGMSVLTSVIPLHGQAAHYSRQSIAVARRWGNPTSLGWACYLSGVFHTGIGKWDQALEHLYEAIDLHRKIGDLRRWESCLGTAAVVNVYQGKYAECIELSQKQNESAMKRGDIQSILWSQFQILQALMASDAPYEAMLYEAEDTISRSPALSEKIYGYGLLAWAHAQMGNSALAESHAQTANRISAGISPMGFYTIAGYGGAAETWLAQWRQGGESLAVKKEARQAVKNLKRFATIFPIGKSRALRCEGLLADLEGKRDKALRLLESARTTGEKARMPHDAERARVELVRLRGE